MKQYRIFAGIAVAAMFLTGLTSCNDENFLKEKSFSFDDQTFFNTEPEMEMGLASCYSEMQYLMLGNMHAQHSWMIQGMGLDTFTQTSGANGFGNWELAVDNGYSRHWMDYLYQLVNRCNTVIDLIDERPEIQYSTATKKNELRAEAIFLRGWAYKSLAGMFGNVVILEHRTTEANYGYEPNTRQQVWEFARDNFKWAAENLPVQPRLLGCVQKASAYTELAEVSLALGEFQEAVDATSKVINQEVGNYHIMTTRFGSRKDEAVDRYGHTLNPYWDLFRGKWGRDLSTGGTKEKASIDNPNSPENAEAIWVCQYNYGTFEKGGGGDSWWRVHSHTAEANWTPNVLIGSQTTRKTSDGKTSVYFYGDDAACYPYGVTVNSSNSAVCPELKFDAADINFNETSMTVVMSGNPQIADGVYSVDGVSVKYDAASKKVSFFRQLANVAMDSIGSRVANIGMVCIPTEFVTRASGNKNPTIWDDPNDFRGSETMMERNFYLPGGTKWFDAKKKMYELAAKYKGTAEEATYRVNASDTTAIWPRLWKFSDDCHPNGVNKEYDVDWYMLRVPEVYLLRAEAYLALGKKGEAAADINVVRSRAGAKACSSSEVDIDYILDERARELLGEEHRFITLNRLSCNPNCGDYVTSKYPTQDPLTSNTMYERVHKYGFGFENLNPNTRDTYSDAYGKTRHYGAFHPWNFQHPIPGQVIDSNTGYKYPQNPGYGE